jgi:hypothetical protein
MTVAEWFNVFHGVPCWVSRWTVTTSVLSCCNFLPVRVTHNSRLQPSNAPLPPHPQATNPPIHMELMSHFLCRSYYSGACSECFQRPQHQFNNTAYLHELVLKLIRNRPKTFRRYFLPIILNALNFPAPTWNVKNAYILIHNKRWRFSPAVNCRNASWAYLDQHKYLQNVKLNSKF